MKFNRKRIEVFTEFLVFGVIMGLTEDLIAVTVATGEPITLKIVGVVTLVAIPFAIAGELIVDRMKLVPSEDSPVKTEEVTKTVKYNDVKVKLKPARAKKAKTTA